MKKLALVIAGVISLAVAGVAIAGGVSSRPSPDRATIEMATHTVTGPSTLAGERLSSKAVAPFRKAIYKETNAFSIGSGRASPLITITCPSGAVAVSGYYVTDGGVVADWNAVNANPKKWTVGLINLTTSSQKAAVGAVCLKK